jgi:hypothetical protein
MKTLPTQPKQFVSSAGTLVNGIYKCDGQIILCDFNCIAILLECTPEKAVQIAKKRDRVSMFDKQLYCTADDFAFLVDELPEAPLVAKQIAQKIHRTSETALLYYFLFDYQK